MTLRPVDVQFTSDADGSAIVRVSIAGDKATAKASKPTYDRLMAAGWTNRWCFNSNRIGGQAYVRCCRTRATGHLVTLARIIAGAGRGQTVKYNDGDRLNLRDDNLRIVAGRAKRIDGQIPATVASVAPRLSKKRLQANLVCARAALEAAIADRGPGYYRPAGSGTD